MRMTHAMLASTTLRNLSVNLKRLEGYNNQLTSGRRISQPSDDPVGMAAALSHRSTLEQLDQHLKNIDEALAWVNTTDAALDSAGQALQRAYELAVAGANDALSADDRLAIQHEVEAIAAHVVQLANTTYGDQYIFAGTLTTTPAYAGGTPPTYSGNAGLIQREIAPGATVVVNVVGQPIFDAIFGALSNLSAALSASDTAGVRTAITSVKTAETSLLTTRAQVGARVNRLTAQRDRLLDVQVNVTELRSKVEDTDYAATLLNFSSAEAVYQAALQVGARSIQPSLLTYLS
jgi:flagellar hook-associated protein 3 FlgL